MFVQSPMSMISEVRVYTRSLNTSARRSVVILLTLKPLISTPNIPLAKVCLSTVDIFPTHLSNLSYMRPMSNDTSIPTYASIP